MDIHIDHSPVTHASQCLTCGGDSPAVQCPGCLASHYCSERCARKEYLIHKVLCKHMICNFGNFAVDKRPSPDHIRGIYCNPEAKKPSFLWIRTELFVLDDGATKRRLDLRKLPGLTKNEVLSPLGLITKTQYCPKIEPPLIIFTGGERTKGWGHGKPNKSLARIDDELMSMKGPLLFAAAWRDLDTTHLRYIVDFLRSNHDIQIHKEISSTKPSVDAVQGIRLNCFGDCERFDRPVLEPVHIPVSILKKPAKNYPADLPVGDAIGIPLKVTWCGKSLSTRDANNPFFLTLHPAEFDFSTIAGTLYITREDRKPLHEEHVRALVQYCKIPLSMSSPPGEYEAFLEFMMRLAVQLGGTDDPSRDSSYKRMGRELLSFASKEGFQQFWNDRLSTEEMRGVPFVPSPYDI